MRIIEGSLNSRGGAIVLNPTRFRDFVQRSEGRAAAAVLTPDDLVVSTIPCSNHLGIAGEAGLEGDDLDLEDLEVGKHLNMFMSADTVVGELWIDECAPKDEPPVSMEEMQPILDWMREHPRLLAAYGRRGLPDDVSIEIMDTNVGPLWRFNENGFTWVCDHPAYGTEAISP